MRLSREIVLKHSFRHQAQIIGVLLLATGLLFYNLAEDSLWGDEIFTAIFAAKSPAEIIAFTASDIHPPLYYLLAGTLSHTPLWPQGAPGPATDWLWRWPSAMAGVLAVAIVYRLGRVLETHQVGLLAALLLALAPIAVKYGQEARMHVLFMTFSVWTTLLLAQALQTRQRKYWIGYTLVTILNLYTMYFAFLIIASHGIWLLARTFTTRHAPRTTHRFQLIAIWVLTILLALIAYLPWWPVLMKLLAFRASVGAVEGGVGSPWAFLPKALASIGPFDGGAWLFLALYLVGLIVTWRRDRALALFGASWLLLPLLLPILLGDSRALHLRYAFVLPVYLFFVALVVESVPCISKRFTAKTERTRREFEGKFIFLLEPSFLRFFVVIILVSFSVYGLLTVYAQQKPDWRGAAQMVIKVAGPGDVVMTGPLWDDERFFDYYYLQPERTMSPPGLVFQLPGLAAEMSESGGRLWLVTRHPPSKMKGFVPHHLYGVTVLEQEQPNYDPVAMIRMGAELCKQAARSAEDWAATMAAGGVLSPDYRASKAGAYLCQGDTFAVAGDYEAALEPYQKMVEIFPGWAGGYATLAKTYVAVDNLPAAAAAFAQAVRFNPVWQGPAADEAAKLAQTGAWPQAIALYQSIVE